MNAHDDSPRATIQLSRGCLVAIVQAELDDATLARLRVDLLEQIRTTGVRAAVLDLSGVDLIDAEEFKEIQRTVAMASLMGTTCVLSGLRAGVASALVDLGCEADGLRTALNVDAAYDALAHLIEAPDADPQHDPQRDPQRAPEPSEPADADPNNHRQ